MKNKYSPVSDFDESFKTLIDEKSDIHSSEVTPPPYSAPNKFIDLEMADGSAQHSAQESTNNAGSDSTYSMWVSANIFLFFASLVVLPNMCVAVLCTASLNVVGFVVYRNVKKIIGFEKMNDIAFYGVCIVNVAVFVLFWRYPDARQLRIFIADLGNAANYFRPTDPENEAPHNEEIELQPFAGQSAEV
ncbi:uncharacterized protein SOCG_02319 [Schizosaccharomyces octosporus yFS286]|uniref:Uncharacterized protein n=1 Tax=Schizosaccharomyces octosporus (strain yFS286) TaxID=483514 RepID=S9Q417_SCHOY|nr:uncharacterized protein SOCG_02319 [Schizosaccharomyces octosporus yFS286]EPX74837.1 hypothetical protein SOCG_02319 [Schizosaccharomyces octosporus yFS286]